MKQRFFIFLFGIVFVMSSFAQQTLIKGSVLDGVTGEPIPDVTITIEETGQSVKSDANGEFQFSANVPLGEQVLRIEKVDYVTKRYPIVVNEGQTVDISGMTLDYDSSDKKDLFIISISDDNLNSEDDGLTDNVSGLLQSSRDVFLNAAAFDFSATFFRPRGLDNANGKVLINGIEMNKQFNGRPQWANWGGLNDVQRNQEFTMGMSANDYTFGDLAGTNNIIMRASKYRRGGRVSYASANRSYTGRIMASYNSGLLEGGWSYSFLASRRFGDEGFIDGTLYDSNSFFAAVEKKINDKHSINFTGIYAQNRRGRSTAITEEVYNLRGNTYNPFWGIQDGEIRNSRVREIDEPILMLNHFWNISSNVKLNTNIAYQFGEIANTRIDNGGTRLYDDGNGNVAFLGGARNPDPTYYQNLPSFFLQDENPTAFDFEQAYGAQQDFINDGQWDWNALYEANANLRAQGYNSLYALQADVIKDSQLSINTILDADLADNIRLNAAINYRSLKSENFARVEDLLGGTGYLDVDFFADEDDNAVSEEVAANLAQSDLRNPNRIVTEGDRYKYNYEMHADVISGFAQAQFKYSDIDFYVAAMLSQTSYQRIGLFENGFFSGGGNNGSFGESDKLDFSNYGFKGGFTYKITGRHLFDMNASYLTKAPGIRNSFSNARQTNATVIGLESEKIQSVDASYIFRSPKVKARLTGFYTGFQDGSDIGFYFTEDLAGLGVDTGDAFVQEILTNIERRHIGAEFGIEAQVTPTIKLKAAASVGQYTFQNNPNLYLTSVDFDGPLTFGDGTTQLDGYHVAGGPERAFQLGFEYRDPDFWNVGVTTNFFSNAYIDVSNLARSANFSSDFDGNTFSDYDAELAREILKQEQFDDYMLVNVIGGKSWKIDDYFIGFFATINNVFDQEFRTGGFEQSRLANFRRLQEDQSRDNGPIFGPRYFFGNGTTYYLNVYVRF
ncbi:carboxypeptidase regulatory-like domain-containing protein [Psychroserpens sp.]|uniref:carboxypeptidase regulatory-like domain-containing protein n=1 Tax=Psychroserpens sp. TaxID=2020870 RepID=UPI001B146703|nr:carboxypeptidase regulatory-like domain-containing protein [Psychroserpens sp.]MBO6607676.1 carboxypeptidase-like regulatory domain-containing protein [Psychroserpens sp.]MBO6632112.1 carboxypeptidase-like regulatory domain-containing protein [Psychroserpens sp.]MBO6654667.1 carboxypeptidase-like regulatory domain-containing protein [Psychroserpens sp.]MBO6682909.1 carboxypeptidase-like regulatory domain-containing protein [Psychroserpens sp.]MBO6751034.1 carboxypeptidase-like regulatory do